MDGVEGDRFLASPPVWEATIEVLQTTQLLNIALNCSFHLFRRGHSLSGEGGQHIPQRSHCQDARGDLLGALIGIRDQVEHRVGERLQRSR